MKKAVAVAALVLVLGMSGVGGTVKDYGTIGVKYVTNWFKTSIPVAVDIERLDLSIKQLDSELASNGRVVVEESVALDRYAAQVADKEKGLAQIQSDLGGLKAKFVSTSCDATKTNLESAMTKRVVRFKSQSETLASMKSTLDRKRESYEKMLAAYEKQKLDRDILRDKLESFRADYASMKMRGELEQSALANSASRKAMDLTIEIADRLEIQRRLGLQRSESFESEVIGTSHVSPSLDLAEVDAIIGGSTKVASR
jgi:hypothetical protein